MSIAGGKAIIHAVVAEDLKLWLEESAKAEGRSLSNLVGQLLTQARHQAQNLSQQPNQNLLGLSPSQKVR